MFLMSALIIFMNVYFSFLDTEIFFILVQKYTKVFYNFNKMVEIWYTTKTKKNIFYKKKFPLDWHMRR